MTATIEALPSDDASVAYLGEDWTTQGDWVGRYGRQYAVLCAAGSPMSHYMGLPGLHFVEPRLGPNAPEDDDVRNWLHWASTDDPRSLWDPYVGTRRQAEWDDHGEAFPMTLDGPDLWIHVRLPAGTHRVSLYFVNKDGRTVLNRLRDYVVEVRTYDEDVAKANDQAPLAKCRVNDFWGGVYKRFILNGLSEHYLRVARNGSFNTTCSAVLVDKLAGPETPWHRLALPLRGGLRYDPPPLPADWRPVRGSATAATRLSEAIDALIPGRLSSAAAAVSGGLLAYRALAVEESPPAAILDNWRWRLALWTSNDRAEHARSMDIGFKAHLEKNPRIKARFERELQTGGQP